MSLTKDKIADFIQKLYQDDYFRFDQISSSIHVSNFEQNDNKLTVDYDFWNDGHENMGSPEYFLFDVDLGDEYDVYFPSNLQHIKIRGSFAWKTKVECENLSTDLEEEFEDVLDVICYKWGDPEIEMFISEYVEANKTGLKDLLVNHYDVIKKGFPGFIHEVLRPHFMKVINND